ncbi:MAG: hypothetical protein C5B49_02215 [Bdellovibrio sp.]|nr:MAG: hypothetical protein C5B49_02215 [Bdellovibrio sp.]
MVVDSSVWIELLSGGPLQSRCQTAIQRQTLRVPTLVLFEVYRKLKGKISEDMAMEAVAALSRYEVLDLTREVAMLAGDFSLEYQLGMADAMVLAHARHLNDVLLTLDNDFRSLPGAVLISP